MEKHNLQKNNMLSQVGKSISKEKKLDVSWKTVEDSEEYSKSVLSHLIQSSALIVNFMLEIQ